jgi:hypothetical protein
MSLKSVKETNELEPSLLLFNEYIKALNNEFDNMNKK